MDKKTRLLVFVLLFAVVITFSFTNSAIVQAQEEKISREEAYKEITKAEEDMQEMLAANFSITEVNDSIAGATNLYNAYIALETKKGKGNVDFSSVISTLSKINKIKDEAFRTYDELLILESRLKEFADQNMSEAIEIFNEAKREFRDGRYEKSSTLIEEGYEKISELQAMATKIRIIYEAGTRTIVNFFKTRYKEIIITITIFLILFFTLKDKVYSYFVNQKIQRLELEREILFDLIKKAQVLYFNKGLLSESSYRIKIKQFSELIRDLNRRLPILKIKIEKIKEKKGIKGFMRSLGFFKTKEENLEITKKKQERKEKQEKEKENKRKEIERRKNIIQEIKSKRKKERLEQIEQKKKKKGIKEEKEIKKEKEGKFKLKNILEKGKKFEKQKKQIKQRRGIKDLMHSLGFFRTKEEKLEIKRKKEEERKREEREKEIRRRGLMAGEKKIQEIKLKKKKEKLEKEKREKEEKGKKKDVSGLEKAKEKAREKERRKRIKEEEKKNKIKLKEILKKAKKLEKEKKKKQKQEEKEKKYEKKLRTKLIKKLEKKAKKKSAFGEKFLKKKKVK